MGRLFVRIFAATEKSFAAHASFQMCFSALEDNCESMRGAKRAIGAEEKGDRHVGLNTKVNIERILLVAGVIIGLTSAARAQTFCESQRALLDSYLPASVGWSVVSVKLGQADCFFNGGEIVHGLP